MNFATASPCAKFLTEMKATIIFFQKTANRKPKTLLQPPKQLLPAVQAGKAGLPGGLGRFF